MTYKLFLDNARLLHQVYPNANIREWVVCTTMEEAVECIELAWPQMVSFDHDLGDAGAPTGYDLAKWMVEFDMQQGGMPLDFTYEVHSADPPGAANIRGLLDNYLARRNP